MSIFRRAFSRSDSPDRLLRDLHRTPLLHRGEINRCVPDQQGVYVFYTPDNQVAYVGQAREQTLRVRVRNQFSGGTATSPCTLIKNYMTRTGQAFDEAREVISNYRVRCFAVEDARRRRLLESLATGRLQPLYVGN